MVRIVPIEVTMMVVPIVAVRMMIKAIVMMVAIVMMGAIVTMVAVPSCCWSRTADCDCADNAQGGSDLS